MSIHTSLPCLKAYEDDRFEQHRGVDLRALARAGAQLLRQRRVVSGGSTLTMQVARLLEPRNERSVSANQPDRTGRRTGAAAGEGGDPSALPHARAVRRQSRRHRAASRLLRARAEAALLRRSRSSSRCRRRPRRAGRTASRGRAPCAQSRPRCRFGQGLHVRGGGSRQGRAPPGGAAALPGDRRPRGRGGGPGPRRQGAPADHRCSPAGRARSARPRPSGAPRPEALRGDPRDRQWHRRGDGPGRQPRPHGPRALRRHRHDAGVARPVRP